MFFFHHLCLSLFSVRVGNVRDSVRMREKEKEREKETSEKDSRFYPSMRRASHSLSLFFLVIFFRHYFVTFIFTPRFFQSYPFQVNFFFITLVSYFFIAFDQSLKPNKLEWKNILCF